MTPRYLIQDEGEFKEDKYKRTGGKRKWKRERKERDEKIKETK